MLLNLPRLRQDYKASYKNNWKTAEKIDLLIEVTKIELQFLKKNSPAGKRTLVSGLASGFGISVRTLQRWKKSYSLHGVDGLTAKAKGRPPKTELSPGLKKLIREYLEKYRWGSEVIRAHIFRERSASVNQYKINRFLDESGLRKSHPCTTAKKVKSKRKTHTGTVVVRVPGEHTQMDVKYQLHLLGNGRKAYVYNFIDHASNWSHKRAYSSIKAKNTADFMEGLLKFSTLYLLSFS